MADSSNIEATIEGVAAAFALMGNTNDLIHWDKLDAWVDGAPAAISEKERCELLLAIANGERLKASQWNHLTGRAIINAPSNTSIVLPENERNGLQGILNLLVTKGAKTIAKGVRKAASASIVFVPDFHSGGERVIARSKNGGICYAIWLLIDPTKPFGKSLRKCGFSQCGRFYLVGKKKGEEKTNTTCSTECHTGRNREKTKRGMRRQRA